MASHFPLGPDSAKCRVLLGLVLLLCGALPLGAQESADSFPLEVETTSIVKGPAADPSAVLDVKLARAIVGGRVVVTSVDGKTVLHEIRIEREEAGQRHLVPVPLPAADQRGTVKIEVQEDGAPARSKAITYLHPGAEWTMHFVPGFHYDPVWWNTQAHYTETGKYMDSHVGPGHTLMEEYLEICRKDPDYKVAIHQMPYLKTFLEARAAEAETIEELVRVGRLGIVGGSYNEFSSTLVSAEATARNAIYGCLFQREIVRGKGAVFWQCDVFGHDPSFPSMMARTGHTGGGFARGPFHQWGAPRDKVNFPSEFFWMAPDGEKVLTHYMTGHYGYAYAQFAPGSNRAPDDPERSNLIIASMFEDLKQPALTHHILLPMHTDFIRPLENLGDVLREWNRTYLSPRAVIDTSEGFFDAVRDEIASKKITVPVITRDMNPIYTGCPVSFADLKTANRAGEVALRDAEIFATIAALEGAPYPSLAIDRAWRQLLFNSHHDGITGSMSDQVYVDILLAYRDALELAQKVRDNAIAYLSSKVDTSGRPEKLLWNSTTSTRFEDSSNRADGHKAPPTGVPPVGYAVAWTENTGASPLPLSPGTTLDNGVLEVKVDPARGGALVSIRDKRSGRELLRGPANDLVVHEEYPVLPGHGEGPWHLSPTGERRAGTHVRATVEVVPESVVVSPSSGEIHGSACRVVATYPEFRKEQSIRLVGARIDFETKIVDWKGRNQLVRVEFPFDLPGARPVYQTAAGVIGRPFARDINTAEDSWTLDQTCWQWVGLGSTCSVVVGDPESPVYRRALGVAEIVLGDRSEETTVAAANQLAEALVKCGVTSTITREGDRRYGDLALDSNLPDFRLLFGKPEEHRWVRKLGEEVSLDPSDGLALVDRPGDLPLLLLPSSEASVDGFLDALASRQELRLSPERAVLERSSLAPRYGVALINEGAVSAHVTEDGNLGLNLLRSCTSWPSGVWIDPPARRLPDGNPMGTMHGSHVYRYSLVVHEGDYRDANLSLISQRVNHPLLVHDEPSHGGELPRSLSFVEVDDPAVRLITLKPAGFPEARWFEAKPVRQGLVVVRLWNGGGRSANPKVRLPRHPIARAWRGNLLEEKQEELVVVDGAVELAMGAHAYETLLLEVAGRELDAQASSLDPTEGDVSSSAYWLENLAEGMTGNGMVGIHPAARHMIVEDGQAVMELRIQNHRRNVTAAIDLSVESAPGLVVAVEPSRVFLGPEEEATVTLTCLVPGDRPEKPEPSLITVTGTGVGNRTVSAAIWVFGDEDDFSESGEIEVLVPVPAVVSGSEIEALLVNKTAGPITGLAEWMTPFALWEGTPEWRQRVTVPAKGTVPVALPLANVPSSFALLRFTYGGHIAYGEAVAILEDPKDVVLTFGQDRVRLRDGEPGVVTVQARGLEGVRLDVPLTLEVPEGWSVQERGRDLMGPGPYRVLAVMYEVTPHGGGVRGILRARGPRESAARVAYTVSPQQEAGPQFDEVVVDAKLDEWSASEFTKAGDELGRVHTAVRYGAAGLALALRVEDDRHVQTRTSARIWEGDSIQFSLSVAPATSVGYAHTDLEFGAALTPIGSLVWCWYGGEGGVTGRIESAQVAIERRDGETFYEISLPRSALPKIALEPGSILGFSYIANDDDGEGYKGATQWTPGMVGGKDASLFGELILVKE